MSQIATSMCLFPLGAVNQSCAAVVTRADRLSHVASTPVDCLNMRGIPRPQFRLRVDEIRVFYDVSENVVEILGIVSKSEAEAWLEKVGKQNEADSTS
jgi:hypothetical protein